MDKNGKYNPGEIEAKCQRFWLENGAEKIDKDDESKDKFYILDMFPYPSGAGLHMGHTESYTASDVVYRYKKLQGFNVLHPQGFDAFGLPAENFAIKTGISPIETTKANMANYIRQMQSLGFAYDFSEAAVTCDPEYYKWTQWIFGEFFKNGLVYKKISKTNWCPSCQTVIANEQVVDGKCERCGTEIEQKEVPSWFFKITDFAEELINDLDKVDWPEYTKKNQKNWIGKSEGVTVKFQILNDKLQIKSPPRLAETTARPLRLELTSRRREASRREAGKIKNPNAEKFIEVFTTRVDTIFGCAYVVLAPENELVQELKEQTDNKTEIEKYIEQTKNKTELNRMEAKEKTGVELKGVKAINPFNNEEIPVFIADYVLAQYGTGAVMAVPAHDERDFEFADKKGLSKKAVISPFDFKIGQHPRLVGETADEDSQEILDEIHEGKRCYESDGKLFNSVLYNDLSSEDAREKMSQWLEEKGIGKKIVNYRLRDWSISRQRYWGCPIPIVYSPDGEAHLVPKEHLPWRLPMDVDFVPTGTSPLAKSEELKKRTEEIFGEGWVAEYDTMDTFVDSSWYFLRYPDAHNDKEFCSKERLKKWLPVDIYIGGAEHTYMHLLFARFFVKAMHRIGLLDFDEPFLKLRHQGMVLDKEGKKMSKSKGNVINPDEMVEKFGADSVRTYMLFAAPLEDAVMWNENNIVGVRRFLEKVWKLQSQVTSHKSQVKSQKFEILLNKTIKKVGADIEEFRFNTAISTLMILVNEMEKQAEIDAADYEKLLLLLSPFAPHIAEELWEKLGHTGSIFEEKWPEFDAAKTKDDEINLVLQVNGKVRDMVSAPADISEDEAKDVAMQSEKIQKHIDGKEIKKIIFVKGKLVNIVISS